MMSISAGVLENGNFGGRGESQLDIPCQWSSKELSATKHVQDLNGHERKVNT